MTQKVYLHAIHLYCMDKIIEFGLVGTLAIRVIYLELETWHHINVLTSLLYG